MAEQAPSSLSRIEAQEVSRLDQSRSQEDVQEALRRGCGGTGEDGGVADE
jgi:hypothetical protein